jgi:hypothetical protein
VPYYCDAVLYKFEINVERTGCRRGRIRGCLEETEYIERFDNLLGTWGVVQCTGRKKKKKY